MAAAAGCVFHRTLTRSRSKSGYGPNQPQTPVVCREQLLVLDVQRYTRDQSSTVCFPQSVHLGEDLYDVTLFDGDCCLRASLDPTLNHFVEKHVLRRGAVVRSATFSRGLSLQLPQSPAPLQLPQSPFPLQLPQSPAPLQLPQSPVAAQDSDHTHCTDSFSLVSLDFVGLQKDTDLTGSRSWFGSGSSQFPLRAKRSVFLPLWNNTDHYGDAWREAPPTEDEGEEPYDEEEESDEEDQVPSVTVEQLRDSFSSKRRSIARGNVRLQLIVRILNKSHLMYYGKSERSCECPYKAVLEVCDPTGSVSVVLWNSVCLDWYRRLRPGDIISLRRYRVKQLYQSDDDIELSVNSRNPAAQIRILPESSVSPAHLPPDSAYTFCTSAELRDRPHGALCDVIGLVTFSGRSERIRTKDSQGAELFLEYRWLRLEDGSSDRPITVKLFATSQPEVHLQLLPMSVVVCTRLKLIRTLDQTHFYLSSTSYSQVYCSGLGLHSQMSYRRLNSVKLFLNWLRTQDDGQVLGRALIGGFFVFPPPPVSMEMYMKARRVAPSLLQGAELQKELDRLCYRERRTFCFQATVTMVTHCRRGQEERCLSWSLRPPTPDPSPRPSPLGFRSPSSSSSFSPASSPSAVSHLRPRPQSHTPRSVKRRLFQNESLNKRLPWSSLRPEQNQNSVILFEASMEFIENTDEADEDSSCSSSTFVMAPPLPPPPVAVETLPMRYNHAHRREQAVAVAMGGNMADAAEKFEFAFEDYYCLRLRVLSGQVLDVVFLPQSSSFSSPVRHSDSWAAILSHGSFSAHGPPPAPADLIATATQLSNQRLLCVLEACHLGGASTELVLSRAFTLSN